MEENRVLTIPIEQYNLLNSRQELHFECPNYYTCASGKDKGKVLRCDSDLELSYKLFDLSNHEIISRQLIALIPKICGKAVDQLADNIDKLMKGEVENINIVEQKWIEIKDTFNTNYKTIPEYNKNKNKYIEEFRTKMNNPIKENIQSLYQNIKNEPKILEYIVEFRFRKYGNRGRPIDNENINEINKKILRKIQNQAYYEKNKKPRMTIEEIEENMKLLKTKGVAWRIKEIKCECGCKFTQANRARHEKTSIVHLRYLKKKIEDEEDSLGSV
jgi:hypothetical protein